MRIIEQSVSIEQEIDNAYIMKRIEKAGRVCYKSEESISEGSADVFIRKLISMGHESVIEHVSVTLKIICDRGVSHEIVRHRIASYSQESTRYCNYSTNKFGNELTFIKPCYWNEDDQNYGLWKEMMQSIENIYFEMIKNKATPQEARAVLPNSLKTELFVTMNLREWRHFLKARTIKTAHPQMRQVAIKVYNILAEKLPVIFEDISVDLD